MDPNVKKRLDKMIEKYSTILPQTAKHYNPVHLKHIQDIMDEKNVINYENLDCGQLYSVYKFQPNWSICGML